MFVVPDITISKYFGKISKCVWFDVPNYQNPFTVDMVIKPNQFSIIQVQISNRIVVPSNPEFTEKFPISPSPESLRRIQSINHIPGLKAVQYNITNQVSS
jgi:hypothetical protein